MSSPVIHVIFRTCDKVNAVNRQPRPFDLSKAELIKICFKSLYESIRNVPHTITVLGDNLSQNMTDFFSGYPVKLIAGKYGNDKSIYKTIDIASAFTNDLDWIYFCEDDYLHRPETFKYITTLFSGIAEIYPRTIKKNFLFAAKNVHPDIAIFPSDYPDRYLPHDRTPHFIFHTSDCHWRQVANTTFTFLMRVRDVKKYKAVLQKASIGADDKYLSETLYGNANFRRKLMCVSPIPGLTAHMHIGVLPPLIDWKEIVNLYK